MASNQLQVARDDRLLRGVHRATLALAGTLLILLSSVGVIQQESLDQALGLELFTTFVGLMLFGAGLVLLGVATLLGRTLPRWCGVALIVAAPAVWILGIYGGGVVLGIVWLALGYALWSARGETVQRTTRVG